MQTKLKQQITVALNALYKCYMICYIHYIAFVRIQRARTRTLFCKPGSTEPLVAVGSTQTLNTDRMCCVTEVSSAGRVRPN